MSLCIFTCVPGTA